MYLIYETMNMKNRILFILILIFDNGNPIFYISKRKYHENIPIKDIKKPRNKQLKYNIDISFAYMYMALHDTVDTPSVPVLAEYNRDTR